MLGAFDADMQCTVAILLLYSQRTIQEARRSIWTETQSLAVGSAESSKKRILEMQSADKSKSSLQKQPSWILELERGTRALLQGWKQEDLAKDPQHNYHHSAELTKDSRNFLYFVTHRSGQGA